MAPGDVQAPRASFNVGDFAANGSLRAPETIPGDALLEMSKGTLKRYLIQRPGDDSACIDDVQKLWRALLTTMRDVSVVDQHMTVVCNAICVFLQSATSSQDHSIRTFVISAEVWMDVFDALLINFHSGKQKPLRQVLNALIKTLAHHGNRARAQSIESRVLSRMSGIIMLQSPQPYFKASIVVFEAFLRSGIPLSRILCAIARCHGANRARWENRLKRLGFDATIPCQITNPYIADDSICHFSFSIVLAVAESDTAATAGAFFARFMSILRDYNIPLDAVCIEHVAAILHSYPNAIEAFKNHLLPPIFKLSPNHYHDLLHRIASDHHGSLMLQNALAIVVLGRDVGLLSDEGIVTSLRNILQIHERQKSNRDSDQLHRSESDLYAGLLSHSSTGVRIQAYKLLVTSTETTRPIRSFTLLLLSRHLVYLQGDADPGCRGEISSITRVMIDRLRRGSALYARNLAKLDGTHQKDSAYEQELEQHDKFLDWLIGFLENELGRNCSFPRHISALRTLQLLVESGLDPKTQKLFSQKSNQDLAQWPWKKSLQHRNVKSALWQLLLDPFEEIRATTALVLDLLLQNDRPVLHGYREIAFNTGEMKVTVDNAQAPPPKEAGQTESYLKEEIASLLEDANRLAAMTNRADHADGVGRLLGFRHRFAPNPSLLVAGVLEHLEKAFGLSGAGSSLPVEDFSLHGFLLGLKYMIEGSCSYESSASSMMLKETNLTVDRIFKLCNTVWKEVRNDLCVDSPELSHDDDATGTFEGPKDFLAYSWRALRDSSLLMQAILQYLGPWTNVALLADGRVQHLRRSYALCFEQLTALRHRGAFSTVAQTFALCCEQFASIQSLRGELQRRYQDAFQILNDQSSKLTRRSAGIPAILAGLLIPSAPKDFRGVIETLVSLARSENASSSSTGNDQQTRLPEVHALNCLREIFTNSKFRARTAPWLIEVLSLAASSLSSRTWAIRNCGLMLFRACANRMGTAGDSNGIETNEMVSRDQSRTMLSIAFELLDSPQEESSDSSELVFAGLDLVSRISLPQNDGLQARRKILARLGSPVWVIREHSARVYAAQLPETEALEAAACLIYSMSSSDQNRCHGVLLCSRELLKKHTDAFLPFPDNQSLDLVRALQRHAPDILEYAASAVKSALVDILNDCVALGFRPEIKALGMFGLYPLYSDSRIQTLICSGSPDERERPFLSQFRCSLALGACLAVLARDPQGTWTLQQVFQDVAARDLDTAAALLQTILKQAVSDQNAVKLLAELYMMVIDNSYAEDITTAAMLGLSTCLEQCLESTYSGDMILGLERLLDDIVELPRNGGRDLITAITRVSGSIFAYCSRMTHSVWHHPSSVRLRRWIKILSGCAKDTTDASTRLNAARSLHCFRQCLLEDFDGSSVHDRVYLYSILYDFLNDDDEEIRALAASTTSFILTSVAGGVTLQLCPLASCRRLSSFMAETFSTNDKFHLLALSRILLPVSIEFEDLTKFADLTSSHSVRKQLDCAQQESHDLFEEERQNLYLDDIGEIEIWHSTLGKVAPSQLDEGVRALVGNWALDGIHELTAVLPGLSHGPFGVSWKAEFVTLLIRVIRMADLSLQWHCSSDLNLGSPQNAAHFIGLEQLQSVTREHPVHPRAQKVLECTVRTAQLGVETPQDPRNTLRLLEELDNDEA